MTDPAVDADVNASVHRLNEKAPTVRPGPAGLFSAGLGVWTSMQALLALAGDFMKPWISPFIPWLLAICVVVLALALVLRKSPRAARLPVGRILAASLIGSLIFGGVIAAQQLGPRAAESRNQGILSSYVPTLAAVQATVLPIPEDEKALLRFQAMMTNADPVAAALSTHGQIKAVESPLVRRAMIAKLLGSSAPPLRQVGLMEALLDKRGSTLGVLPTGDRTSPLGIVFTGAQLSIDRVDETSGAVRGISQTATYRQRFYGMVANGELTIQLRRGYMLHLKPDQAGQLSGLASAPGEQDLPIRINLY